MLHSLKKNLTNPDTLTYWMNHLLVIYAFLLPISKYAGSFIFFIILILFLLRRNFLSYLTPVFKNNVVQAFILFFIIHIVWLIGTENMSQAKLSINLAKYSLFPIIFLSFIDKRFSPYIIGGFISGMLFSELFSYAIQFHLIPWKLTYLSIPIYQAYLINDPSPFLHHSHYAASIAFVSVLLMYKMFKSDLTLIQKGLSLFFITTISINLSLVGGRVGYLLYISLILFLILYIYRKKFVKPFISILLLISSLFIIAYSYSPMFKSKIQETQKTAQGFYEGKMDFRTSFGSRVGFWYYASDIIKENWIVGVGTGDYMDTVRDNIPSSQNNTYIKNSFVHPHNIYVMILLQFGIIGLIVFFNIFYQMYRQKVNDDYLNFIKLSVIITFVLALMTETFWARYYLPFFVLIVSITLAFDTLPSRYKPIYTSKIYIAYAILLLLAILNAKINFIIAAIKSI